MKEPQIVLGGYMWPVIVCLNVLRRDVFWINEIKERTSNEREREYELEPFLI